MKRLHLKIYGRVQGVFFRDMTCQKAEEFDLVGTVQNCSDDTVEIVVEGEEEHLKSLLEWCKEGPKRAEVMSVEEEWGDIKEKTFDAFNIIYAH